jgi:YhcH/YjgK/YiaL family protein
MYLVVQKKQCMKNKILAITLLFTAFFLNLKAQDTNKWTKQSAKRWLAKKEWSGGLQLVPHFSVNVQEFARQYHRNKPYWDAAFRFIREHDLTAMPAGKYPIDGENVFATITEDPSKDLEKTNWESHRKYLDLQYIVSGEEVLGIYPSAKATVTKQYDEKRDAVNYSATGKLYHSVPGTFFLFFPSDAHRPNITPGGNKLVKKLVIKIKYAE